MVMIMSGGGYKFACPAESEESSNISDQEKCINKDEPQNWKDEVMVLR